MKVAKFIEIMFIMHPSHTGDQGRKAKRDSIYELILQNRLNHANLAPSLMKFYTDVEQTGGSNEFYDKFSIRHHIQGLYYWLLFFNIYDVVIMSSLWENQHYRDQIVNIGNNDPEFIRFVNMLINDTTFLLDEAIASLKRIHEIQEMKKNEAEWNSKNQV